jgi:hypothetical protein
VTRAEAAALTLRKLMEEHELTQREVAQIAMVGLTTVEGWLADPKAASFRKMSPRHINVIRVMLPGYLAAKRGRKGKT